MWQMSLLLTCFWCYLQFNTETTNNITPLTSYLKFTCHYLECLYDPLSVWRLSLEKFVLFIISRVAISDRE